MTALEQLNALALELDHAQPGAAASLREGMEETLTVTRLGPGETDARNFSDRG